MTDLLAIRQLTSAMQRLDFAHIEPPVSHFFSDGVYVREIFMPKGSLVVGKVHATTHLNIVSKGICIVVTALRSLTIDATKFPQTFESAAGEQKVVYMIEDVVWSTVHVTDSKDLKEIESKVILADSDSALIEQLLDKARGVL